MNTFPMTIPAEPGRPLQLKIFRCWACGWEGQSPSISDASEMRSDGSIDRTHVAVCPRCFHNVRVIR